MVGRDRVEAGLRFKRRVFHVGERLRNISVGRFHHRLHSVRYFSLKIDAEGTGLIYFSKITNMKQKKLGTKTSLGGNLKS